MIKISTFFASSILYLYSTSNRQKKKKKKKTSQIIYNNTKLTKPSTMEYFNNAKVVRLRSQHQKYLTASEDEEGVKQHRNGSSKKSRWSVEAVDGKPNLIRLKSCYSWKYLSASDETFLLGMTGRRVLQTSPRLRLDPSVEWEPIKEGSYVKLRSRIGNFLRGNGGVPPWNNSVTHDVPSRTSTQDWVLWSIDVLEADFDDFVEEKKIVVDNEESISRKSSSNNSSANESKSTMDDAKSASNYSFSKGSKPATMEDAKLSSNYSSSKGSTPKMEDATEDLYETDSPVAAPKSARSRRSNHYKFSATPSPKASPTESEKSSRYSPAVHDLRNDSQHSNSFNKLKSMLNGVQDLLEDTVEIKLTNADAKSENSADAIPHHPHELEVKMAKQTLKELKNLNFEAILTSGRDKKMDKSINVLIADAKVIYRGNVPKDLINLQNQLKSMRNDHEFANKQLEDYKSFSDRRVELKAELKKEAAKAHELETLEEGYSRTLETARAKRDELLRQLEEVESSIKVAETTQADNSIEIEELIAKIGEKSQSLREMETAKKSWRARKDEAERTLESVEEEWIKVKSFLQDV